MSASSLVDPHGGVLVDRLVPAADAAAFTARAATLPTFVLDARELADLELIATGAASPLTGFLDSRDYRSVLDRLRLADGTVWPLPFTLAVAEDASVKPGDERALADGNGRLWGVIAVTDVFTRDPLEESRAVYGTEDPAHPGVAYLLSRPRTLVGGSVQVLPLGDDRPFLEYRLSPRELRARIAELGWKTVAGFQTRNPIHRAHEHLTKIALEVSDGLVIHPLVGETKQDDVPASVRFEAYESWWTSTTRRTGRSWPRSRRRCATPARARRSSTRSPARTTASTRSSSAATTPASASTTSRLRRSASSIDSSRPISA